MRRNRVSNMPSAFVITCPVPSSIVGDALTTGKAGEKRPLGLCGFMAYISKFQKILNFQKSLNIRKMLAMLGMSEKSCCEVPTGCRLEALVSVDDRGQIVLPKDVREKAGIKAGEKLAIITCMRDGKFCCMSLVKASDLAEKIKEMLGPLLQELLK